MANTITGQAGATWSGRGINMPAYRDTLQQFRGNAADSTNSPFAGGDPQGVASGNLASQGSPTNYSSTMQSTGGIAGYGGMAAGQPAGPSSNPAGLNLPGPPNQAYGFGSGPNLPPQMPTTGANPGTNATLIGNQTAGAGTITDRNRLTTWVLDTLQRMRNFRRPYDQRRAYFYRQYIGQRDRRMYPDNLTPRSNTFVPIPKSNVDHVVARTHDAFFSIDPPIEVRPKGGTPDQAWEMQAVMLTCLKKANWVKTIELAIRDCAIYGHTGIKVDWDWDYDWVSGPEPVFAMQPKIDPNTNQPVVGPDGQPEQIPVWNPMTGEMIQTGTKLVTKKVPRNCPKFIPIDIYDLLLDPDGKQKAQVMEMSWGELKRTYESKPDLFFPEAIAELTNKLKQYRDLDANGIIIRMAEFWDDTSKTTTIVTFGEDADAIGWKDRRYQYRNASYSAYKRRVYNGPPVLLYTGPNPFAHKRIPILDFAYVPIKGDAFGIGLIETISDLAEGVNVFTNMITDNWNLGINKRYAYDVQVDIDHDQLDLGNVPGGKVGVVGDPSKAIWPFPSFTPNQQDYMILDLYQKFTEAGSGIDDFYSKGIGTPGPNVTASGIDSAMQSGGYSFKLFIRRFELEILQPLCEMVASMIQQFGTDELEWSITDAPPGIPKWGHVPLVDLFGDYAFDFVGANYATGKVVKQRNLMAFYGLAMQSPYAVQGEFLREIARSMEIPFASRLLKTDQQVQSEMQASTLARQQEEIVRELFKMEAKIVNTQAGKPEFMPENAIQLVPPGQPHGEAVQAEVERYLADAVSSVMGQGPPPTAPPIHPVGRPKTRQFEGPIPGGQAKDSMRQSGQELGLNKIGLGG